MILDGGLGLELERGGFRFSTKLWSGEALLTNPGLLVEIHRAYLAAGAQVIATATYQLSHVALRQLNYDDAAIDGIFAKAVNLARTAIADQRATALVAASLGPYGATVGDGSEYSGVQHLDRRALYAFHAERVRAMVRAQPDIVLFETIPSEFEAVVIAEVARDLDVGPVWISLSCRDGSRTFAGDDIGRIGALLDAFAGVEVIGVNCTAPAAIASLVRVLRSVSAKSLMVCPNLGQHWDPLRGLVGGAAQSELVRLAGEWRELGVEHVGGCCGVGPPAIAALAAALNAPERATL